MDVMKKQRVNVENFNGQKQIGVLYMATGLIRIVGKIAGLPFRVFRKKSDFKSITYF